MTVTPPSASVSIQQQQQPIMSMSMPMLTLSVGGVEFCLTPTATTTAANGNGTTATPGSSVRFFQPDSSVSNASSSSVCCMALESFTGTLRIQVKQQPVVQPPSPIVAAATTPPSAEAATETEEDEAAVTESPPLEAMMCTATTSIAKVTPTNSIHNSKATTASSTVAAAAAASMSSKSTEESSSLKRTSPPPQPTNNAHDNDDDDNIGDTTSLFMTTKRQKCAPTGDDDDDDQEMKDAEGAASDNADALSQAGALLGQEQQLTQTSQSSSTANEFQDMKASQSQYMGCSQELFDNEEEDDHHQHHHQESPNLLEETPHNHHVTNPTASSSSSSSFPSGSPCIRTILENNHSRDCSVDDPFPSGSSSSSSSSSSQESSATTASSNDASASGIRLGGTTAAASGATPTTTFVAADAASLLLDEEEEQDDGNDNVFNEDTKMNQNKQEQQEAMDTTQHDKEEQEEMDTSTSEALGSPTTATTSGSASDAAEEKEQEEMGSTTSEQLGSPSTAATSDSLPLPQQPANTGAADSSPLLEQQSPGSPQYSASADASNSPQPSAASTTAADDDAFPLQQQEETATSQQTQQSLPFLPAPYQKEEAPCPRWGHSMTDLQDGRLLVYGGQTFDTETNAPKTLNDLYVYSMEENKWYKQRVNGGATTSSGGGSNNSDSIGGLPRQWHTATFLPDRNLLICLGGESRNPRTGKVKTTDPVMVLDTEIMLWYPPVVSGDVPSGRSGHTTTSLLVHGGTLTTTTRRNKTEELVLFGGVRGNKWLSSVSVLNMQTWVWRTPRIQGMAPPPRSYHSATAVSGNRIVIFGGNNAEQSFNTVHVLEKRIVDDGKNGVTTSWHWSHPKVRGHPPVPRTGHSATLLNDQKTICIYGGWDHSTSEEEDADDADYIFQDSFLLDTEKWQWKRGPAVSTGNGSSNVDQGVEKSTIAGGTKRVGHTAVLTLNNDDSSQEITIFGGRVPGDNFTGDFESLHLGPANGAFTK